MIKNTLKESDFFTLQANYDNDLDSTSKNVIINFNNSVKKLTDLYKAIIFEKDDFIATGNAKEEIEILDQILKSDLKEFCIPLNNLNISKIIPIIKNCDVSICNDSSFSHLSAALNIPTIVLMADTPLVYGSYSSLMHPILPEGANTVSHDTLGKDKISPSEIQKKLDEILSNVS